MTAARPEGYVPAAPLSKDLSTTCCAIRQARSASFERLTAAFDHAGLVVDRARPRSHQRLLPGPLDKYGIADRNSGLDGYAPKHRGLHRQAEHLHGQHDVLRSATAGIRITVTGAGDPAIGGFLTVAEGRAEKQATTATSGNS